MNRGDEFDIKKLETLLNLRIAQINYFISLYDRNAQAIQRVTNPEGEILLNFPQFIITEKVAQPANFGPHEANKKLTSLYKKFNSTTAKKLHILSYYGQKLNVQELNFRFSSHIIESYNSHYDFECNIPHITQIIERLSIHVNEFFDRIIAFEHYIAKCCTRSDET